jgi:cytoskeleton-associated protein 5
MILLVTELEFNARDSGLNTPNSLADVMPKSPTRGTILEGTDQQEKLSRLHDIFQYRSSTLSTGSSQGRTTPGVRTSLG